MPDPITLIAIGSTVGVLLGCFAYWKMEENAWERASEERAIKIQEGEDAYYAAKRLAEQRRNRVPLAQRLKDIKFTEVSTQPLGYALDEE